MAFTYGTDEITKREYDVYITTSIAADAPFDNGAGEDFANSLVRVGAIAENPTLTTEKGEEVTIGTGDIIPISENYTCEFSVYQVTSANLTALRSLHGSPVDVYLTDTTASLIDGVAVNAWSTGGAVSDDQLIKLSSAYIYAALNIQGNAQNSIDVSISKEQGVATSAITFTEKA